MGKSRLQAIAGATWNTLVVSALLLSGLVQAQTGAIKLMVGFPAGGGTDAIARTLADKLKDRLGPPVIVENRAGAGGQIAAQALKAAPASVPDFIENHKAGKVRIVAVLGAKRQAALPDVPTFAEMGLAGFEDVPFYGIFAPAGTPKATTDRFSEAVAKVVALPEVRDRLTSRGPHHQGQRFSGTVKATNQAPRLPNNQPSFAYPSLSRKTGRRRT